MSYNKELFDLCEDGETKANDLSEFIEKNDVDVNCLDADGDTPLEKALQHGNYHLIKPLVNHGSNINAFNKEGYTILSTLADRMDVPEEMNEVLAQIEYLVGNGAYPEPLYEEHERDEEYEQDEVDKSIWSKVESAVSNGETLRKERLAALESTCSTYEAITQTIMKFDNLPSSENEEYQESRKKTKTFTA